MLLTLHCICWQPKPHGESSIAAGSSMADAIDVDDVDFSEMASELSSKLKFEVPDKVLEEVIVKRLRSKNSGTKVPEIVVQSSKRSVVSEITSATERIKKKATLPQGDLDIARRSGAFGELTPRTERNIQTNAVNQTVDEFVAQMEGGEDEVNAEDETPLVRNGIQVQVLMLQCCILTVLCTAVC